MLDSSLRRLLEEAVNTSTKLTIVLLYTGQLRFAATPQAISQRLCQDIWSVEEALRELAGDGILMYDGDQYHYCPGPEWSAALARLVTTYDEPLHRQEMMRVVSDLDRYAPYRDFLEHRKVVVSSN
jgi:hypothetical protein